MSFCYEYPRPAVTVDLVVVAFAGKDSQILLVRRGKDPYKGRYALPGGFLNLDETGKQAALREFTEETRGALPKDARVDFLTVADAPDRDPRGRVISLIYTAYFEGDPFKVEGSDDADDALWIPVREAMTKGVSVFAFDHKEIIAMAGYQLGFNEEGRWPWPQ